MKRRARSEVVTLSIDIGGTGLKASILDWTVVPLDRAWREGREDRTVPSQQ